MNHAQAQALIFQKLDTPLSPEQEAALQAHLAGCADCRALSQELSQLDTALLGTELTPPAALHDAVMQRVCAQKKPAQEKKKRLPLWLAAAAVLVLLLGLGGFLSPGYSANGQAAVSIGSAADSALTRLFRADDRKFARSFAAAHNAQALAVWTDELPQALRALSPVQEEDGAVVYEADRALLDTLAAQAALSSELFGAPDAEAAYILIFTP